MTDLLDALTMLVTAAMLCALALLLEG